MRRFIEEYGFVLGAVSLAALAAGVFRSLVLLYPWTDPITLACLIVGLLLGALFILGNQMQVRAAITKRGTRYGLNAIVMSIAFILILVGLNVVADRFHWRGDLTELQVHTLSPQSRQVLAAIDREVTIVGFFGTDSYGQQERFEELLNQYRQESAYITYEVIDPDRDPLRARQYEEPYSGLLIRSGDRIERVYSPTEQDITRAFIVVTSDEERVVYFLTGHGERDPESAFGEPMGYSTVAEALRDQNYEVRKLQLAITDTVPSDATVVVIAGPRERLLEGELTKLQSYLVSGGRALILQDPFTESGLGIVLSSWQVGFGGGIALDPARSYQYSSWVVPIRYSSANPITSNLDLVSLFVDARPIQQTGVAPAGITYTPLALTTEQSWSETSNEVFERDDADIPGPLTLMAAIESPPIFGGTGVESGAKTRIVLVGDADLATNDLVDSVPGNMPLFLNAVNWLAEEERLIAIGPKTASRRPVHYEDNVQRNIVFFVSIIVIPSLIGAAGIAMWAVRRIRLKMWSQGGGEKQ